MFILSKSINVLLYTFGVSLLYLCIYFTVIMEHCKHTQEEKEECNKLSVPITCFRDNPLLQTEVSFASRALPNPLVFAVQEGEGRNKQFIH